MGGFSSRRSRHQRVFGTKFKGVEQRVKVSLGLRDAEVLGTENIDLDDVAIGLEGRAIGHRRVAASRSRAA